ncbi:MAG: glycosyltransferase family 4 protein [Proteobacteria bacterium]|nr:glycosyltransferase family 4 protein [Pseudomonadota bacterium]
MTQARTIAMPISSFLPSLGGAEIGLHNIASRLLERGLRPVVMAPAPHVKRLREDRWRLPYTVEALPPKAWSLLRRAPWVGFFVLDRYFARMQARYRFDCWHCTMGYPTGVALVHFARKRADVRYLIRCAGEDIQRDADIGYGARLDPRVDRVVRDLLPQADMLIAISDSVAEEYRAIGVAEARIRHVPNGVDLARFEGALDRRAVRARHGLDPDAFVFLSVGRNHPKKNYIALIEATARLAAETERRFQLLIVGGGVRDLAAQVERHGLAERVRLCDQIGGPDAAGGVPALPSGELVALYRSADAFVFPSLIETFGIAVVEAMAAGLPVIVGDSPGCRDVVRHGRDGLVVPARDAEALADAMSMLITDDDARRAYAAKAKARAFDFSWDRVIDAYTALYEELYATR